MNTVEQTTLALRTRRCPIARSRADADLLIDILRKRKDLQGRPSEIVCQFMQWNKRKLRAAAEASDGRILSAPGCVGYRLAEDTSVSSYYATERARYLSQIKDMQLRLTRMDACVHSSGKN
jgi:hypothetical protein